MSTRRHCPSDLNQLNNPLWPNGPFSPVTQVFLPKIFLLVITKKKKAIVIVYFTVAKRMQLNWTNVWPIKHIHTLICVYEIPVFSLQHRNAAFENECFYIERFHRNSNAMQWILLLWILTRLQKLGYHFRVLVCMCGYA